MKTRLRTIFCVAAIALLVWSPARSANNRPLLFGMNPTPMSWWGYDPMVWEPLLFAKMAEAGCTVARIGINWDTIEGTPGVRDWSQIDYLVNLCLDNNIEPLLLLNSTATYALPGNLDPLVTFPEARYPPAEEYTETFNQWIYDAVHRYRGRARYFEFWNEANGYGWYTALQNPPSYSRADLYTPWMIRAYKQVKRADPTSMMSTTGMDDGGGGGDYMLQKIYDYGGQGYFDAVADHPYSAGNLDTYKLDDIKAQLNLHGDTHVKIWITEFGYAMNPSNYSAYQGFMTNYFNTLTQDTYDAVRISTWHTANEFPWEAGYGLTNSDLTPKPPYTTFKNYSKPSRPTYSNVSVTHLSPSSVRINYTTNVAAKGLVMFGLDKNYGRLTGRDPANTTSHQAIITGLQPSTVYHYRIRSGAVEDGDSFSSDMAFATNSGQAVQITAGPTISNVSQNSATVSWSTNVASSSTVQFGTDFNYASSATSPGNSTSHAVQLTGLVANKNYLARVVSTAAGLADGVKEADGFTTLQPTGQLVNGSFEQGTAGWTFWEVYPYGNGAPDYPGHVGVYTNNAGAMSPTPATKDGAKRLTVDRGYASAIGGVYQTVSTPNGIYQVSGWVAMGSDSGDEIVQLIAKDGGYSGGIPDGVLVANLTGVKSPTWGFYSKPIVVTTGKLTIATRTSQFYAAGVVGGHFDGISIMAADSGSLAHIKQATLNSFVGTDGQKPVTAVLDNRNFSIEEPGRASGIRVRTAQANTVTTGKAVQVSGTLIVENGELIIDNANILNPSDSPELRPLAITPNRLGGVVQGSQPAVGDSLGINTTGLLVRTWGRFIPVNATSFKVDDGVSIVKCICPAGSFNPAWQWISIVGISGAEISGGGYAPVVRARSAGEISGF